MKFIYDDIFSKDNRFHGEHILVADDNDMNLEAIKILLQDRGLLVDAYTSGEELLTAWNQSPEYQYPVALLDINMLGMDGYATAQAIRQSQRGDSQWIALFAVSANILMEQKQRALQSGMNGYVLKPIDYAELFERIHDEIEQRSKY